MNKKYRQGILAAVLLLAWGSYSAGSKKALQELDVFQLNQFVFLSALLVYVGICLGKKVKARKKIRIKTNNGEMAGQMKAEKNAEFSDKVLWRRERGKLLLCGCLAWGYFFFYNLALYRLPAMEASIINYCFPVLILVFDAWLKRTGLRGRVLLSSLTALAGVIVLLTGGSPGSVRLSDMTGDALAFAAACCWALFSVLSARIRLPIAESNLCYMAIGTLLSALAVLRFSSFGFVTACLTDGAMAYAVALAVWLGGVSFALSNYLWLYMLGHCSLETAAAVSFLTPFVTVVMIAVLLGERIRTGQFAGLLLIMLGIWIQQAHLPGKRNS